MGELLCHDLIKLLFLIKVNGVLILVSMMNMYAYLSQIMN